MNPTFPTWFDTAERRSLLLQVSRLWDGTPFFPNSCAPGQSGGVDCVNLLNAIYSTCACIPRQEIPRHAMDASQHAADRSPLIEAFETWPDLKERFVRLADISPENLLAGDALCFRSGHVPYHGAVMLIAGEIVHVIAPAGVHRMQLAASIRGHRILGKLEAVYRPTP